MKHIIKNLLLLVVLPAAVFGQAENVPASHPVYPLLKRWEVMGIISGYHDAVIPISRKEVAAFLAAADTSRTRLSTPERAYLDDLLREFRYDLTRSTEGFHRLITSDGPSFGEAAGEILSEREKFLFFTADSENSAFLNLLLDADARRISGDDLGSDQSTYLQLGGRLRGTILGRIGYHLQWTNAQFWGSRELLARDRQISQSYALYTANSQNFDFAESYLRYDGGPVSAQVGRERLLWGAGYQEKMTLSDNVRLYDFIRFDATVWRLRYTFVHAWLAGHAGSILYTLPSDPAVVYNEPTLADKYFAAHRIEFALPGLFDFGAQEMVIYSNRAPDLAYLNPLTIIESAQRSRGERDNVFWAFDIQTHFISNVELTGTLLFDDINVPDLFSNKWYDRHAWQLGAAWANPFTIPSTSLFAEYTRVEPYVFTHGRSRDNSYTSFDAILGPVIGPNADAWTLRCEARPLRRVFLSASYTRQRSGENVLDPTGRLIKNVGGDPFQPYRGGVDPETKIFLDGNLVVSSLFRFEATWEFINQFYVDFRGSIENLDRRAEAVKTNNTTLGLRLRTEW